MQGLRLSYNAMGKLSNIVTVNEDSEQIMLYKYYIHAVHNKAYLLWYCYCTLVVGINNGNLSKSARKIICVVIVNKV